MTETQTHKHRLRGVVVSDKAAKTITVEITRRFQHPKYGKFIQKRMRVHAHDAKDEAHMGDTVEIIECRPLSRLKRWRLVEIIQRGAELIAVAGVPAEALKSPPPAEQAPAT